MESIESTTIQISHINNGNISTEQNLNAINKKIVISTQNQLNSKQITAIDINTTKKSMMPTPLYTSIFFSFFFVIITDVH